MLLTSEDILQQKYINKQKQRDLLVCNPTLQKDSFFKSNFLGECLEEDYDKE